MCLWVYAERAASANYKNIIFRLSENKSTYNNALWFSNLTIAIFWIFGRKTNSANLDYRPGMHLSRISLISIKFQTLRKVYLGVRNAHSRNLILIFC